MCFVVEAEKDVLSNLYRILFPPKGIATRSLVYFTHALFASTLNPSSPRTKEQAFFDSGPTSDEFFCLQLVRYLWTPLLISERKIVRS
jgi:hypothetical protein